MSDIRETLNQRNSNYGKFMDNAVIAVQLQAVVEATPGYKNLEPDQIIALQLIFQKIGRALSGDAQYDDNWRDIAGYAQLIVDRINGTGCYATQDRLVRLADCHGEGSIVPASAIATSRCRNCHAVMGDVHASDCNEGQEASSAG